MWNKNLATAKSHRALAAWRRVWGVSYSLLIKKSTMASTARTSCLEGSSVGDRVAVMARATMPVQRTAAGLQREVQLEEFKIFFSE
jgi:hypothetical protein